MLRIPQGDEETPLLVAAVRSIAAAAAPEPAAGTRVRRRKRKRSAGSQEWDKSHSEHEDGRREGGGAKWWLLGGATGLLAVLAAVVGLMQWGKKPANGPVVSGGGLSPAPMAPAGRLAPPPDVLTGTLGDAEFLKLAEPLAKRFMEAASVDELLPLVRNPETAEPRMRAFYQGGRFKPFGYSRFNTAGFPQNDGSIRTVIMANSAFEEKALVFEESPSGIKIDWENWVRWSEMSWKDFMTAKPVSGKIFPVVLSDVDYFNFAFTDDRKWRCYYLTSADGEHAVYGYVIRGSELESKLRLPSESTQSFVILRLKYPEEPVSPNQVIIEGIVADGWVMPNKKSQ